MKTLLSLILFTGMSALAKSEPPAVKTVLCQLQSFKHCADCTKRIPASCENRAFNGSIDVSIRPLKLHWLSSDPKNGTEKMIIETNKKTLAELKISKDKRELVAVEIPASTALYKDQSSTAIAAVMTTSQQTRAIASESSPSIGGIGRAQKACGKKGCL